MIRSAALPSMLVLAAAFASTPVFASDEDFALAFPLTAPADEPMFAVELPAEAYATLATPDLRDLVVVDAEGREQPISLHRPTPPPPPQAPETLALALPIAVPGDASATPGRLELHVRRDGQGRLDALDLQSVDASSNASSPVEWLIDVGEAADDGIDGLRLQPEGPADFRTLVDIRGSNDLVHWEDLQSALPLLRASNGERRIERLDLRFARTTHRYLALRPVVGEAALPALTALVALRRRAAEPAPLALRVLEAAAVTDEGRTLTYGRPGPLPVQQIEVRLAEGDGILEFQIEERVGDRWLTVGNGIAWRLSIGGETLASAPTPVRLQGAGELRLRLAQAAAAPRLVLAYAPDRVIVMANGRPPFRLLAGSAHRRHDPVAMDSTLAAIRLRQGDDWQPPLGRVGAGQSLGGAAALAPRQDPGRLGLWLVLGLGALGVGGLAWRLLKAGPPASPN